MPEHIEYSFNSVMDAYERLHKINEGRLKALAEFEQWLEKERKMEIYGDYIDGLNDAYEKLEELKKKYA